MSDGTERMDTEEFAARVAAPLKAPVALRADFEARVMAQVAEAARPWWRRRRQIALSPLGGLALAAGFGALMVLGGYGLGARQAASAPSAAPGVQIVRFVLDAPDAQSVMLAGDFNGWSRVATPMEAVDGTGRWAVTLTLPFGRHEYAFVVDGERWVADPYAQTARDEFGQESSVMRLEAEPRRGA
ncbi:MAG: isoamylase early set domain-containing protein [Gemmatimonadaceae bacterium]|nr:isoamylase early set domain-containing protein [Gemmatimonadaceae bacterium]MCW5825671.1 isoamylase early set domain-containing protein [Gemmatimonadaceae bacterium]